MRVMRIVIVRRSRVPTLWGRNAILILVPILSIALGILACMLIFYVAGVSPWIFLNEVSAGFTSPQMVRYFFLLTALGTALAIAFRASIWNIGAEGQMILGMIGAGFIGLFVASKTIYVKPGELSIYENMPSAVVIDRSPVNPVVSILNMDPLLGQILMILVGSFFGALWALIPAFLRAYFGINEAASTLIMNYVAYHLYNHMISTIFRGLSVQAKQFFRTDILHEDLRFQPIPGYTVTYEEVVLATLFFLAGVVLLGYTSAGLRLKVMGSNPHLLRVIGINERKYILLVLLLSGFVSGAVGASIFAGITYKLETIKTVVSPPTMNLGYTAVLVVLLSLLDLRLVPVFAWIVASLFQAGVLLEIEIKRLGILWLTGASIQYLLIGTVLMIFVLTRILAEYEVRVVR